MKAPAARQPNLLSNALGECRAAFFWVAVFSLGINLLMLTSSIFMLQVFDRVLTSRSKETLVLMFVIALLALLTMAALEIVRTFVMVRIDEWIERRVGGPLLGRMLDRQAQSRAPPSSSMMTYMSSLRQFLTGPAIFPVLDAPWTPIFLGVIFMLHPYLGWLSFAGACILLALAVANDMSSRNLLGRATQQSASATRFADTMVRNAEVVIALGMRKSLVDRWEKAEAEATSTLGRASGRGGIFSGIIKGLRQVLQMGIMAAGAWFVIEGDLTPGAMIAASILMGRALAPVDQAVGSWKAARAALGAYRAISRAVTGLGDEPTPAPLPPPTGLVEVERVSYVYPNTESPVLQGVSFRLTPGEALAVIGPSAAGKTTLGRLLVGVNTPSLGHVRLDGMDVAKWHSEDLGQYLGYLPQDVELFGGTIRENISRMQPAEMEQIVEAARMADVHDMIMRLPKGYETDIGEGGAALSGGERQRVALARALFGNPRLLVLDEPNASLDQSGETALVKALGALRDKGITVIVIAHRASILRHVDKVLVLRDGRVNMFGPRDEIMPKVVPSAAQPPPQEPREISNA